MHRENIEMSDLFKDLPAKFLELLQPEKSVPAIDSKLRDGRPEVEAIKARLHEIWREGVLPKWSEKHVNCLTLLWFDYLELAHQIADEEKSTEFYYFHAMIHRRERDFFNARFWFRQTDRRHVVFAEIAREVRKYLTQKGDQQLLECLIRDEEWVPLEFLEEILKGFKMDPTSEFVQKLRDIQTIEFACWFKYLSTP